MISWRSATVLGIGVDVVWDCGGTSIASGCRLAMASGMACAGGMGGNWGRVWAGEVVEGFADGVVEGDGDGDGGIAWDWDWAW